MAVVNTNISASIAQSALMKNDRALGKAMEQLSTGSRVLDRFSSRRSEHSAAS